MIGYLEGKLLKLYEDRILLLVNHVGYEVLLPTIVMEKIVAQPETEIISFYIYFHQTERQPKPVLIGFNNELDKEFFQLFITVEDIGPLKAVKAFNLPVSDIVMAIEQNDIAKLQQMKGIGARTAQKIVATLKGKLSRFISVPNDILPRNKLLDEISKQVLDVLTTQLGYKPFDAKRMITETVKLHPTVSTPEELLEELFRGKSQ